MKTDDEARSVAQVQLPGFTPDSWFPRSSRMRTQPDASLRSVPNTPHDERSLRDDFRSVKEERPSAGVRDGIGTNVWGCRRHARQEGPVGHGCGSGLRSGSCKEKRRREMSKYSALNLSFGRPTLSQRSTLDKVFRPGLHVVWEQGVTQVRCME